MTEAPSLVHLRLKKKNKGSQKHVQPLLVTSRVWLWNQCFFKEILRHFNRYLNIYIYIICIYKNKILKQHSHMPVFRVVSVYVQYSTYVHSVDSSLVIPSLAFWAALSTSVPAGIKIQHQFIDT